MGWADDMYEHGLTNIHGGVLKEHDDQWEFDDPINEQDVMTQSRSKASDSTRKSNKRNAGEVIRNCKIKYRCPMKWTSLEETSDSDVRYCPECKKTVHYCQTDEKLRIAILEDYCVAIRVPGETKETRETPNFDDFDDDMELGIPF